jgi:hypothetical protein
MAKETVVAFGVDVDVIGGRPRWYGGHDGVPWSRSDATARDLARRSPFVA